METHRAHGQDRLAEAGQPVSLPPGRGDTDGQGGRRERIRRRILGKFSAPKQATTCNTEQQILATDATRWGLEVTVEATLEAARAMETGPGTEPCYREFPRMSLLGSSVHRANIASGLGCWHHARKTFHGGTSRGL
jgi:hypothetical protein